MATKGTYRDANRIVRNDGWELKRQRGSHRQYKHPLKKGTVTINGNDNVAVDIKIWKSIMRQAQIEDE